MKSLVHLETFVIILHSYSFLSLEAGSRIMGQGPNTSMNVHTFL